MEVGALDRQIVIQQNTQSIGANGERTDSWSTFVTVWAGIEYGTGGEGYKANQLTASNDVSFVVRYYPGITERMRISYDSAYWDIVHIAEVGRQRFLVLKAQKID